MRWILGMVFSMLVLSGSGVVLGGLEHIPQDVLVSTDCEFRSAVVVLRWYGFGIDVDEFRGYVPAISRERARDLYLSGINPFDVGFVGDAGSLDGIMCNASPLCVGIGSYLMDALGGDKLGVKNYTGVEFSELVSIVESGSPVILWISLGYVVPYEYKSPYGLYMRPSHCVVMCGVRDGEVCFMDSTLGMVWLDKERAEGLYDMMGQRAVVVHTL